ncbi:hypothetical protein Micbo1qcDRAFT_223330 [Microdochium bolleyi]|uniref:Zn(2)-C6 fungal-type domain-containing protein n=1 Tax=Microdochium bolleyi TaxID=196109 RepID=A0A136IK84_9PEZI|nr:hypothetical protein Micbo1qcDRAFT_223330 [Microdochium bolleyi]
MRRHIRHACDSCRRRKARCDGTAPVCTGCRSLGINCEYGTPRAKRGPKPRTSVSTKMEVTAERSPQALSTSTASRTQLSTDRPAQASGAPSPAVIPVPHHAAIQARSSSTDSTRSVQILPHNAHRALLKAVEPLWSDLVVFGQQCVEHWVEQSFAVLPILDAYSTWSSAMLLLPKAGERFAQGPRSLSGMGSFALLTACCAQTLYSGSMPIPPGGERAADAFLTASRSMLVQHEEADVAQPTACSLAIRVLQASALHSQGKTRMAGYVIGQATRLVLDMRSYDEEVLAQLGDSREVQLRRNLFWVLHSIDKSIALVGGLPSTLHIRLIDPAQLEHETDGTPVRLLEGMPQSLGLPTHEHSLRAGFDICNRQWLLADGISRTLDLLASFGSVSGTGLEPLASQVTADFVALCGLPDTAPAWLCDPAARYDHETQLPQQAMQRRREAHWAQHVNILVTHHCLKLLVLARAAQSSLAGLLGSVNDERLAALRSTEVAAELVGYIERVPMKALKANGEALVEKLRKVGVILLEISYQCKSEVIVERGKVLLGRLLNLIASLDSKASDTPDENISH